MTISISCRFIKEWWPFRSWIFLKFRLLWSVLFFLFLAVVGRLRPGALSLVASCPETWFPFTIDSLQHKSWLAIVMIYSRLLVKNSLFFFFPSPKRQNLATVYLDRKELSVSSRMCPFIVSTLIFFYFSHFSGCLPVIQRYLKTSSSSPPSWVWWWRVSRLIQLFSSRIRCRNSPFNAPVKAFITTLSFISPRSSTWLK